MKITAICTVYNKEPYLKQTLDSMIAQQVSCDYEIMVVDDCSTDGSRKIIQSYKEQYPDLIRVVLAEQNKGITRTWKSVVPMADGDYIARMDGDDYWTDPHKLQKQLDFLNAHPESGWCATDFDFVDADGKVMHKDCLKNGFIKRMDSFETMIVNQGFTGPSSWLIKAELMKEVTEIMPDNAVDDTFCLQLDMFRRTVLVVLEESTTAYRIMDSSDSHIEDPAKMRRRMERLHDTQMEYIKRYPDADLGRLAKESFDLYMEYMDKCRAYKELLTEKARSEAQLEYYRSSYESVVGSGMWKATAPARKILDKMKNR